MLMRNAKRGNIGGGDAAIPNAIHPIAGPGMDAQFQNAFAYLLAIPDIMDR